MRKVPDIKATDAQGRPMANSGGLRRQRKKLRHQIKTVLRDFDPTYEPRFTIIRKGAG